MPFTPRDDNYRLEFIHTPEHVEDDEFVQTWADNFVEKLVPFAGEPFALTIGERHSGSQEYAWLAKLYTIDEETKQSNFDFQSKLPIRLDARQSYFAHNREDSEQNYSGVIEISIIMMSEPAHDVQRQVKLKMETLLYLAYAHYYARIAVDYQAWRTDYLDAPYYETHLLGKVDSLDEFWPDIPRGEVQLPGFVGTFPITERHIVDYVRHRAWQPTGIIVIGGNDESTARVTDFLVQQTRSKSYMWHEILDYAGLVSSITDDLFALKVNNHAFINLIHGTSSSHELRHQAVQRLRDVGAKSVILIWVKGDPKRDNPNAQSADIALRQDPPTIDGLDALFIWQS